jgi:hypothetical protein
MCYHDIYALSSHRLFNRTGLYAESHGIVANVSHKRAVLNDRLTRCAEFLGCGDRLRFSLQQRLVLLGTSLVARRTGAAVALLSVIFALAHACERCGKRLGEQDSLLPTLCGQFRRVTFFLRCPTSIVRPGPPQTLSGASPTYFIPFAVCTLFSASRCFQ